MLQSFVVMYMVLLSILNKCSCILTLKAYVDWNLGKSFNMHSCVLIILIIAFFADSCLIILLSMSIYTAYAFLPQHIYAMISYFGLVNPATHIVSWYLLTDLLQAKDLHTNLWTLKMHWIHAQCCSSKLLSVAIQSKVIQWQKCC